VPHIEAGERRDYLRRSTRRIPPLASKAELNYVIARLLCGYLDDHGTSYQTLSDAKAAATDCAAEFQRLLIDPYEDTKIAANGNAFE
jgi:hypothetical protein